MAITITYKLTGHGWAQFDLNIHGQEISLIASYLSDALGDLLSATTLIASGGHDATAALIEEPGEHRIRFLRIDSQTMTLRVIYMDSAFSHKADERGKLIYEAHCNIRDFARALLTATQELWTQLGDDGYRAQWLSHEYPYARRSNLQKALHKTTA